MKRNLPRTPGFTLIEIVFAAAILAIVLAMTTMAMQMTLLGAESTSIHATLDNKASAIVDMIAKELKDGGTKYSNFAIDTSQQSITFARSVGCANGKPVFGNQITYSVATYGSSFCLERTEVIGGVAMKQILTDQLVSTAVPVTTQSGVTINVTGINFQRLSADAVTVTVAVQQGNFLLKENGVVPDNFLIVTSQAAVPMLND